MPTLVALIALALCFDFINGFHDAANSIATVVSTRVLSPRVAVGWAAFFNFMPFLVFGTHVAGNIAKGVDARVVTLPLVAAGLVGAVLWDLLTWWRGLPTSSSHALLGVFGRFSPRLIDKHFRRMQLVSAALYWVASALRRAAPSPCSWRRLWASPCRRRTRSPARSSAWAACASSPP